MVSRPSTLQLEVTLRGIRPPIRRRIVVDGDATLADLHVVLQVAMGWEGEHLHCFRVGDLNYGPEINGELTDVDEATVSIAEVFGVERRGIYEYDLGDSWEHQLLVEKTDPPVAFEGVATCTAGRRACPRWTVAASGVHEPGRGDRRSDPRGPRGAARLAR